MMRRIASRPWLPRRAVFAGADTMSYLYDPEGKLVARSQSGSIVKQD